MNKQILIFFVLLLISNFIWGQQETEKKKITFGFNAGILFSETYRFKDKDTRYGEMTFKNKFNAGFLTGIFASLPISSGHFSVLLELNYNFINRSIEYYSHGTDRFNINSYIDSANFNLYSSYIQPAFIPTIQLGNKIKTCVKIGGFFGIPISNKIKGQIKEYSRIVTFIPDTSAPYGYDYIINENNKITKDNDIKIKANYNLGILIGVEVIIPYKKDAFGIELRSYLSPCEVITRADFYEYTMSFSLTYRL